MMRVKKMALWAMAVFYFVAGLNHFVHPHFYENIIPPYLHFTQLINLLSGFAECALAILLLFVRTRKLACWLIILMLIVFIPTHIYLIQKTANGNFQTAGVTVTPFVSWARLPLQIMFIWWAYWCASFCFDLFKNTKI